MTGSQSDAGRDLRVCFVGDSYVAGVGDPTALGWVGRVTAEGIAAGLPLTAYNLGVRGETSTQIARRMPIEVAPRLTPATDPRLVVSFGVNDTVESAGRLSASTKQTLRALKDMQAAMTVPMLLVGPPAVGDPAQDERLAATSALLARDAGQLGVPFIETFGATYSSTLWRQQVRDGDGYHPATEGYALLASVVARPLLAWLHEEMTAPAPR
ncbi:GDSL-type esterase/lipase family protein [Marisediminicola sp. LYQ85]|uniref:GDSL-type esterase/lipase family protein n=1 Tax=Marisediminicola sp. LYQ85 TaxID=3391062 RepID=UPI0039836DDA